MENAPVEKDKWIGIGMVYSCGDWISPDREDYFCVIIGAHGNRLYYCRKKKEPRLQKYELVSFVDDEHNPNEAKYIIPLKQYIFVSRDNNSFKKPDGTYCSPEEWDALQRGVPFIGLSRSVNCISFPVTTDKLVYYKSILHDDSVVKLFRESEKYENATELTIEELKNKIAQLQKYIEELDVPLIINTFSVRESGGLVRRVGRDDFSWHNTTRKLECDDLYLNHLLKTGEVEDYDGASSSDKGYSYIDTEATQKGIQTALSSYNKDDHFAYLLHNYITSRNEQILKKSEIELKIKGYFDIASFEAIGSLYEYTYKRIVERHNEPYNLLVKHYKEQYTCNNG